MGRKPVRMRQNGDRAVSVDFPFVSITRDRDDSTESRIIQKPDTNRYPDRLQIRQRTGKSQSEKIIERSLRVKCVYFPYVGCVKSAILSRVLCLCYLY